MNIAAHYATLVKDQTVRERVYGHILAEYEQACVSVKFLTQTSAVAERFPLMRERFRRIKDDLESINMLQVELLCEARAETHRQVPMPLLLSMNSIAAALGWTG